MSSLLSIARFQTTQPLCVSAATRIFLTAYTPLPLWGKPQLLLQRHSPYLLRVHHRHSLLWPIQTSGTASLAPPLPAQTVAGPSGAAQPTPALPVHTASNPFAPARTLPPPAAAFSQLLRPTISTWDEAVDAPAIQVQRTSSIARMHAQNALTLHNLTTSLVLHNNNVVPLWNAFDTHIHTHLAANKIILSPAPNCTGSGRGHHGERAWDLAVVRSNNKLHKQSLSPAPMYEHQWTHANIAIHAKKHDHPETSTFRLLFIVTNVKGAGRRLNGTKAWAGVRGGREVRVGRDMHKIGEDLRSREDRRSILDGRDLPNAEQF
ncbi:hypothetical protein B0H11DRAFT_1933158 [Mycena galericulata]|nr:hypothetical protein B0H11DRAFT_1933158 [Mycena galericulata]